MPYISSPELASRFQESLPADPIKTNGSRQVENACYSFVQPQRVPSPQILSYSRELACELGLDEAFLQSQTFAHVCTGNQLFEGSNPYAMCYGGHQFGNWAGQLGDGRAINLGELKGKNGRWFALQLKGAGPTPYSRFADGLAVLRSSIREYLCSEAMHHLGIPTTRALSLGLTGEQVERDMFYNGKPEMEPGAVVTRVASSFLRFGNFEIFAARGDEVTLEKLIVHTITCEFPHLLSEYENDKVSALLQMMREISASTCELVVHWMRVGFVHGVMNTDNMSVAGLTIDYGPYGWLDNYDPGFTPNTTDFQNRRYRYENQAAVAQWNLLQLANALYVLIKEPLGLEQIVKDFRTEYERKWLMMMCEKLGLSYCASSEQKDFIASLLGLMEKSRMDMTLFYRHVADIDERIISEPGKLESFLKEYSYNGAFSQDEVASWRVWFQAYLQMIDGSPLGQVDRQHIMGKANPVFILRNYLTQVAIDKAYQGDFSEIDRLMDALKSPYKKVAAHDGRIGKRPAWAENKAGCSALSCSS